MTTSASVTKTQFAALRGVTPGRVTQWITEGKIHGPALDGVGRSARIVVAIACEQLGVTLDPVQAVANGQQASLPVELGPVAAAQSEAFNDQRRFARIKADQAEMAFEREKRNFDAEIGRYMLADYAEAVWSKSFGKVIAELEAALPTMAMDMARQLPGVDPKQMTILLRNAFRSWRTKQAELAALNAEAEEPYMADPVRSEEGSGAAERRSDLVVSD